MIETHASIIRRILALIIDLLVLDFVVFSSFGGIIKKFGTTEEIIQLVQNDPNFLSTISTIVFIVSLFSIFYFAYMEYNYKQTIGQMILNIYVVTEMKKPKWWQYVLNNLFLLPFFPFILIWIVDPMYILLFGRRLSEKFSKMKTIYKV